MEKKGFGLAWAISEFICRNLKSFCFFATHFHELTEMEKVESNVKNLHVTAITENEQLVFLYSVRPGPCDQSFGIAVAEIAGFPLQVVELAKRKLQEVEALEGKGNQNLVEKIKRRKLEANQSENSGAEYNESELLERDLIVSNILQQFKSLPLQQMNTFEIQKNMKMLLGKIQDIKNRALKDFLEKD